MKHQSNALWPTGTCTNEWGSDISTDTHDTAEQAHGVCCALNWEGFGGERTIFPLATWVSEVQQPPQLPDEVKRLSMIRTPSQYTARLDEACKVAGNGGWFWNERFISALQRRGLMLATQRHPRDRDEWYPANHPMRAPVSFEGPLRWPDESLVVWAPGSQIP